MAYIVAATGNQHKLAEYAQLLADQNIELKSLNDYPNYPEPEENGTSFKENACIKAVAACKYCDVPAFADDSGLEVEALDGAPGIYSSRYAPTDPERIAKLLDALSGKTNRRARFVCCIAIAFNGEIISEFEGEVKGQIADAPRGCDGFGYDPLFIPDGSELTFGEMSAEQKDGISHRRNALEQALEFVTEQLSVINSML